MSDEPVDLSNLKVSAMGAYAVQLMAGHGWTQHHRVDLRASIDPTTGEVRFFVDPGDLAKLKN